MGLPSLRNLTFELNYLLLPFKITKTYVILFFLISPVVYWYSFAWLFIRPILHKIFCFINIFQLFHYLALYFSIFIDNVQLILSFLLIYWLCCVILLIFLTLLTYICLLHNIIYFMSHTLFVQFTADCCKSFWKRISIRAVYIYLFTIIAITSKKKITMTMNICTHVFLWFLSFKYFSLRCLYIFLMIFWLTLYRTAFFLSKHYC